MSVGGGQVSDRMLVWVDGTKRRNVSADGYRSSKGQNVCEACMQVRYGTECKGGK